MAAKSKVKSHSGAKKRFKISGTGKILFKKNGLRHILSTKSRKRKRQLKESGVITGTVAANIRRILPYNV